MPYADLTRRREYQAEYREKHRSRSFDYKKAWREKLTPEQKEQMLARRRNSYHKNKEIVLPKERARVRLIPLAIKSAAKRLRRYGITQAQYDEMLIVQGGVCALCQIKPPVDVDHCHSTGEIRGLLCRGCNVGLGQLGDTVEGLQRAITYLQKE